MKKIVKNKYPPFSTVFLSGEFCCTYLIANRKQKYNIRMQHLSDFNLETSVALQLYQLRGWLLFYRLDKLAIYISKIEQARPYMCVCVH